MTAWLFSFVLVVMLGLPSLAAAQQRPAAPTDIEVRAKRERAVVLPQPPVETAVRDAEEVRRGLEAEGRRDALIRESRERRLSRPELDYSVVSGIQADRLRRALRR